MIAQSQNMKYRCRCSGREDRGTNDGQVPELSDLPRRDGELAEKIETRWYEPKFRRPFSRSMVLDMHAYNGRPVRGCARDVPCRYPKG
jgi:hypothetical protein